MCSQNLVGLVAHELSKLGRASISPNSNSGEDQDIQRACSSKVILWYRRM